MSASPPYPPHPCAPATPQPRRWWQHPALVITLLVLLPPAGILLTWLGRWTTRTKIVASVLAGLWCILPFISDPPEKKHDAADAQPTATASPTASAAAVTAEPTPTPTPSELPMPSLLSLTYTDASQTAGKALRGDIRALSAFTDVELPENHGDWIVCFQSPTAGVKVAADSTHAELHLVSPGTTCPKDKNTEHHTKPTHEPAPHDDSTGGTGSSGSAGDSGSSSHGGSGNGSSGGGSSSSGGGGAVVHPGSFCSPAGAAGVTKKGTPMVCGPGSDGRDRWHS